MAKEIFTRARWQRVRSLGKTRKTIDLELLSPLNGNRDFVQVKSQSDLETFLDSGVEVRPILFPEVDFPLRRSRHRLPR